MLNVDRAMLLPAVVLAGWSIVVLFWTAARRFPAMKRLAAETRVEGGAAKLRAPGGRGSDLEGRVAPRVMWPSHNYTHLMEQPTIFYPIVIILALIHPPHALNHGLAWGYVGLRVAHSLWQILDNRIFPVRFGLFLASTACLIGLVVHAGVALFHH